MSLGDKIIGADVWITMKVASPLATWARNLLGVNKWDLARETFNGGMLGIMVTLVHGIMTAGFHWYHPFLVILDVIFWWSQLKTIQLWRNSENGWLTAMIKESGLRIYLVCFYAAVYLSALFVNQKPLDLGDYAAILASLLITVSLYIKAAPLPPPPPPRESTKLAPALSR